MGTRWLCPRCQADPANVGWAEAHEFELSSDAVPEDRGVVELVGAEEHPIWNPSPMERRVFLLREAGSSVREIAKAINMSIGYVAKVLG